MQNLNSNELGYEFAFLNSKIDGVFKFKSIVKSVFWI